MSETPEKTPKQKGIADICILVDITGSMQPCMDALHNNITAFVDTLTGVDANGGTLLKDWRACICGYRDFVYEPQWGREHMVMNPFVRDAEQLKKQLAAMKAEGGGDEPESLLDALYVIMSRGKTAKGAEPDAGKWRYASDAVRCIVVFTDASFHPVLTELSGGGGGDVQSIIQLLQQERVALHLFAPAMACYGELSAADKCVWHDIGDPEAILNDPKAAVNALRDYTSDMNNFTETLKALAKTITQTAAGEADEL